MEFGQVGGIMGNQNIMVNIIICIKSGLWREWDYSGRLRFESVYIDGVLKQIKNYD